MLHACSLLIAHCSLLIALCALCSVLCAPCSLLTADCCILLMMYGYILLTECFALPCGPSLWSIHRSNPDSMTQPFTTDHEKFVNTEWITEFSQVIYGNLSIPGVLEAWNPTTLEGRNAQEQLKLGVKEAFTSLSGEKASLLAPLPLRPERAFERFFTFPLHVSSRFDDAGQQVVSSSARRFMSTTWLTRPHPSGRRHREMH